MVVCPPSMQFQCLTWIGLAGNVACEEMWDTVVLYAYGGTQHVIESIGELLQNKSPVYDDLITKWIGCALLDDELGDALFPFFRAVDSYDTSVKEFSGLVSSAAAMLKMKHLAKRLHCLTEEAFFASELHRLLLALGFPKFAFETFVRTAKANKAFKDVTFHLTKPKAPKRVSFARPLPGTNKAEFKVNATSPSTKARPIMTVSSGDTKGVRKAPRSPDVRPTSVKIEVHRQVPSSQSSWSSFFSSPSYPPPISPRRLSQEVPKKKPSEQQSSLQCQSDDLLATVRSFLSNEDQDCGFAQLLPAPKQDAFLLLNAVLRGKLVPYHTNAYYVFGFVATQNQDEERRLANLYAALLRDAPSPPAIFCALTQGVAKNTLVDIFATHDFPAFAVSFPHVAAFLSTPPATRPTVWRLKHFMHDKANTEPPACLRRDYGFKYCRMREEVQSLKDLYARVLRVAQPRELHDACVKGRLFDLALQTGVGVDAKVKRLMMNDAAALGVGFDDGEGLAGHAGRLFRRKV
jgi:hypothetical protein